MCNPNCGEVTWGQAMSNLHEAQCPAKPKQAIGRHVSNGATPKPTESVANQILKKREKQTLTQNGGKTKPNQGKACRVLPRQPPKKPRVYHRVHSRLSWNKFIVLFDEIQLDIHHCIHIHSIIV